MTEKTWTYQELTATTERQIEHWKKVAKDLRHDNHYREWALGALMLWKNLTELNQLPADLDRLEDLAESVGFEDTEE